MSAATSLEEAVIRKRHAWLSDPRYAIAYHAWQNDVPLIEIGRVLGVTRRQANNMAIRYHAYLFYTFSAKADGK